MSEMSQHFASLKDRIKHLQEKIKDPNLTPDNKIQMLNECLGITVSLGNIALEKMKRGDHK
jgi:hypothetical protein